MINIRIKYIDDIPYVESDRRARVSYKRTFEIDYICVEDFIKMTDVELSVISKERKLRFKNVDYIIRDVTFVISEDQCTSWLLEISHIDDESSDVPF